MRRASWPMQKLVWPSMPHLKLEAWPRDSSRWAQAETLLQGRQMAGRGQEEWDLGQVTEAGHYRGQSFSWVGVFALGSLSFSGTLNYLS